jgi:tetratricopeptide (TPR) repeat protein
MTDLMSWKRFFKREVWKSLSEREEAAQVADFQEALGAVVRAEQDAEVLLEWLAVLGCAADRILAQPKMIAWLGLFDEALGLPVLRGRADVHLPLLRAAGLLRLQCGQYPRAHALFSEMLTLAEAVNHRSMLAEAKIGIITVELYQNATAYTQATIVDLLAKFQDIHQTLDLRMHLCAAIGFARYYGNNTSNGLTGLVEQALQHWEHTPTGERRRYRNRIAYGRTSYTLIGLYRMVGNLGEAWRHLELAEVALMNSDYVLPLLAVLTAKGSLALHEKRNTAALDAYHRALVQLDSLPEALAAGYLDDRRMYIHIQLGMAYTSQGVDLAVARLHYSEALRLANQIDSLLGKLHAYHGLGVVALKSGARHDALQLAEYGCGLAEALPESEARADWLLRYDRLILAAKDGENPDDIFSY